jgi:hypothetical protein
MDALKFGLKSGLSSMTTPLKMGLDAAKQVKDTATNTLNAVGETTDKLGEVIEKAEGVFDEKPKVENGIQSAVATADDAKKAATNLVSTKTSGGSQLKKMSLLLKKAANKLPSLSDINSKTLKRKVKSAKKKLLKASEKAHKASKKVRNLMMKGGILSRRLSRKLSSRKRSSRRR